MDNQTLSLQIENIGKLKNAHLKIDGISIIAGENNTGKSTICKALYSIVNSVYFELNSINYEAIRLLSRFTDAIRTHLLKIRHTHSQEYIVLYALYQEVDLNPYLPGFPHSVVDKLDRIFSHIDDTTDTQMTSEKMFFYRFKDSIKNLGYESFVIENRLYSNLDTALGSLFNPNETANFKLKQDNINLISFRVNHRLINSLTLSKNKAERSLTPRNITYIESPMVLDFANTILRSPAKNEMGTKDKIQSYNRDLLEKISRPHNQKHLGSILGTGLAFFPGGDFSYDDLTKSFQYQINHRTFDIGEVATGIKSFGILKLLVENQFLREGDVIIFDEPEVHLHPAWQIEFVKIIIGLQKRYNCYFIITTHSPYFLEALNVYGKKMNAPINNYLTKKCANSSKFELVELHESYEESIRSLALPFLELENDIHNP